MMTQDSSWLSAPAPILKLFKTFPLTTVPDAPLPAGCPVLSDSQATLFIWSDGPDRLSFNPSCLKWQAYLRFSRLPFTTLPSTNHAAPSGSLPFLIPAASSIAIPSPKFPTFLSQTATPCTIPPPPHPKVTTFNTLLASAVHPAWLYALYISPLNIPLLTRLYVAPASSSPFIRASLLSSLQSAALSEITAITRAPVALADPLYSTARTTFAALDAELAKSSTGFFFDSETPSEFDAAVFAYIHLLMDESFVWGEDTLACSVVAFGRLVELRDLILGEYFGDVEQRVLSE